jgi:hypothetical protein
VTDIVAFLTARLDEDEAGALATTPVPIPGRWKAARDKNADDDDPLYLVQGEDEDDPGSEDYSGNSPVIAYSAEWQVEGAANLRHIARHDPARVLREVAAKRRVLERHTAGWRGSGNPCLGCNFGPQEDEFTEDIEECPELRDMASVYADHPDYNPAWRVE